MNKSYDLQDLGTPNEKIWPGYSKLPAVQKMTFTEYPVSQLRSRFGTMITDVGMDLMNRYETSVCKLINALHGQL
jgi:cell division cycle 2-like protein